MGAEQSLIGGRKRSRSVDSNGNQTFEAYKAVRTMLEEQGKDFEKQVFLDLPDARVLKRLGIFEDCDIGGQFDDKDCKNSIKNIVINAHGSLVRKENEENIPISLDVPENIVVLFMGELGYITWSKKYRNVPKEVCHKELVPNQIGLPGSTIPNVSLSAEYKENHEYSTGIYDCDLNDNDNDNVNQFEGFEHYLIPTEEKVTKSMKPEVKEMLQKATQKAAKEGKEIIKRVTLKQILPEISKKIPKNKYGFVYVFSCLGACEYDTKDDIELYTKPKGLSPVRGYTVKKIPARIDVSRYSLGDGEKWDPVLTNDGYIIDRRNWFVENYPSTSIENKTFITIFRFTIGFKFGENWRDHLPDLDSHFIQNNKNKLRKYAVVNHFKFIDLLHEGDLEKIKKAWNMQFKDETKFLLPYINYSTYSKKNLGEEIQILIVNFEDNTEIFNNIEEFYKQFENTDETIKNFIKKRDLEGLKKIMFKYMKYSVDGNKDFKNIEYKNFYEKEEKDETDDQNVLNTIEAHDLYSHVILFGSIPRDDEFIIENKDKLKNALDIKPYIDYVNSDEYEHPLKVIVIENMNKINRFFGNINEKEEKIMKLFEENDIKKIKDIILDNTKNRVKGVDYFYMLKKLADEGYDTNIFLIMYMHWVYDGLIQNGTKSYMETFINNISVYTQEAIEFYKNALDIQPYIDYVNSAEYDHTEKDYVINQMYRARDALGFTGVQQRGQVGQGRVQQYGGMWQRGGFFMTCS